MTRQDLAFSPGRCVPKSAADVAVELRMIPTREVVRDIARAVALNLVLPNRCLLQQFNAFAPAQAY